VGAQVSACSDSPADGDDAAAGADAAADWDVDPEGVYPVDGLPVPLGLAVAPGWLFAQF
jgi:hypothetical protein